MPKYDQKVERRILYSSILALIKMSLWERKARKEELKDGKPQQDRLQESNVFRLGTFLFLFSNFFFSFPGLNPLNSVDGPLGSILQHLEKPHTAVSPTISNFTYLTREGTRRRGPPISYTITWG